MRLPEAFENITISKMLEKHPRIGEILTKHRIDCVACSSGSCLFKNVVATHSYDPKQAQLIEREINDYLSGLAHQPSTSD